MDMFLRKVFNSNKLGIIVFLYTQTCNAHKNGHARSYKSYVFNLRLYMGCEWSDQSRFSSKLKLTAFTFILAPSLVRQSIE